MGDPGYGHDERLDRVTPPATRRPPVAAGRFRSPGGTLTAELVYDIDAVRLISVGSRETQSFRLEPVTTRL